MPPLSSNLRNQLERTVVAARDVAEEGAWAALQRLDVDKAKAPGHLSPRQRDLRVPRRKRQIAELLATGESTGTTSKRFGLSAARVSQLRRQLKRSWEKFVGEGQLAQTTAAAA